MPPPYRIAEVSKWQVNNPILEYINLSDVLILMDQNRGVYENLIRRGISCRGV